MLMVSLIFIVCKWARNSCPREGKEMGGEQRMATMIWLKTFTETATNRADSISHRAHKTPPTPLCRLAPPDIPRPPPSPRALTCPRPNRPGEY